MINHYKDKEPLETVNYIKGILTSLGIETIEKWSEVSEAGTYSLRVELKGTSCGTNGKGISKSYALASAYGELMERLQNHVLFQEKIEETDGFLYFPDEQIMENKEIREHVNDRMKIVLDNFFDFDSAREYIVLPYYNLVRDEVEYLPMKYTSIFFGTNGMSGGNTKVEALVQAFLEIIERHVLVKLYNETNPLPSIPEEHIKKYDYVYDMYKKIKQNQRYNIYFKDCSFGGLYPVVAFVIIEKNTGKYGIKLGCHPDMGIALERAITEAGQNRKIYEYTESSMLQISELSDVWKDIRSGFRDGSGTYPYQILLEDENAMFSPCDYMKGETNKKIYNNILSFFKKQKLDVYVRNVSYSGFFSYQVIIPNFSEIDLFSEKTVKEREMMSLASGYLENIKNTDKIQQKIISIALLSKFNSQYITRSGSGLIPSYLLEEYPYFQISNVSASLYLLAMLDIRFGKYMSAANIFTAFLSYSDLDNDIVDMFTAMKFYCELRNNKMSHYESIEKLEVFFDKNLLLELNNLFEDEDQIIYKQFPDAKKESCKNDKLNKLKQYELKLKKLMKDSEIVQDTDAKV